MLRSLDDSRMRRGVLAAIALAVAASALLAVARPSHGQGAACTTTRDKTAAPPAITLGETVTVTLSVAGTCPQIERKADVVLVIDRSGSMVGRAGATGTKLDAAKDAALEFVDIVDTSLVQVGLIAFEVRPEVAQAFTTDKTALRAAISGVAGAGQPGGPRPGGTNIVDALDEAHDMVTGTGTRPDAQPVIVFLTDGQHSVRSPALQDIDPVIDAVRADGIVSYAVGLGTDADRWLLRRIAGRNSRYYHSPTTSELTDVYREIAGRITATSLFDEITIDDVVPANMKYVPASSAPAAFYDAASRTLSWTLHDVQNAGDQVTYRLEPQALGTHPTNVVATGNYVDGLGNTGHITFPVPTVTVNGPPTGGQCVCRITERKVPATIIAKALADPSKVGGWNQLLDPGKPGAPQYPTPGHDRPPNARRTCLDLQNRAIQYHPTFNTVVWRDGCLAGPNRGG